MSWLERKVEFDGLDIMEITYTLFWVFTWTTVHRRDWGV